MNKKYMLISLIVIIVFASYFLPRIIVTSCCRVSNAMASVDALMTALKMFKLDNGFYPTHEQGLEALIKEPKIEPYAQKYRNGGYVASSNELIDPWGNRYAYLNAGGDIEIVSYGSDGKKGGDEAARDISSRNLYEHENSICFIECISNITIDCWQTRFPRRKVAH